MASIKAVGDRVSMLAYMLDLDTGTTRIKPRPWFYVTLARHAKRIANLAAGGQ